MGEKTNIEWTDASWTPIRARYFEIQSDGSGKERVGWHCEHLSEGCRNCYAETMNRRLGTGLDFKPGELYREEKKGFHNGEAKLFLDEKMLLAPLRWKKPRMIFVCSMTDLFADFVPDEWIDKVFAVMALCPQHTFQVLTKRAARMRDYFAGDVRKRLIKRSSGNHQNVNLSTKRTYHSTTKVGGDWPWPLPNVWLGVSTERQQEADERIPLLLQTPAAIRFISAEPLLGPIDLQRIPHEYGIGSVLERGEIHGGTGQCIALRPALDWIIVGGESGPDARPMHPDWARSLRQQCQTAGVAFFFKQWGEFSPYHGPGQCVDVVDPGKPLATYHMCKVGKKSAGRALDGIEYNEMPQVMR
jgi:protein gp37